MSRENYALITGGSSGIGLAFARELAADGWNLVLVSRDKNLESMAEKLKVEFDVNVETLRADLSIKVDLERVEKRLIDETKPVEILINSAGFVLHESLVNGNLERQMAAFAVMAEAILILSQAAAQTLKKRGAGRIINIASTSAWLYNGNYSALKRWVVVYTSSLALELRGTGVTATAVCPGETKTDFHANGGRNRPNIPEWLWCQPEQIARTGLRAAEKGRAVYVPTIKWRLFTWACQHFRGLARLTSHKTVTKRIKETEQKNDRN
ncbi:SDR family NAD(P)-dependent oxidoreductase [Candidatus Saccharibacteria bacterium]|nr:SDR family NAD(P)-dependent oxidoreductase [Candidatus Saccharibacteria bacterium]